jgi:putative hemolysin
MDATREGEMFDFYKMRKNQVHKFRPKVEISHSIGSFQLKTVSNSEELIEALKLRYQVFHREMIGKTKPHGIDVDEFDFVCDHLIIRDQRSNRIVGTYRLNCSLFSNRFYSENEFEMAPILTSKGTKLELGRACIDKEFRRGAVISLLWKGIALYMAKTNSDLVFGCASVKTQSPRQAALLYRYFEEQNRFRADYFCPPKEKFSMPNIDLWIQSLDRDLSLEEGSEAEALVPSLCQAYLKAGAYLGGEPAYDEEFKCIDFLTILEKDDLNKTLWKKHTANPTPAATELQVSAS